MRKLDFAAWAEDIQANWLVILVRGVELIRGS